LANAKSSLPSEFAGGRYQVKRLLGEGASKLVYLARAMGLLGEHPNVVNIYDIGEDRIGTFSRDGTKPSHGIEPLARSLGSDVWVWGAPSWGEQGLRRGETAPAVCANHSHCSFEHRWHKENAPVIGLI